MYCELNVRRISRYAAAADDDDDDDDCLRQLRENNWKGTNREVNS